MGKPKAECDLTCPKCHKTWAKMKYEYGSFVKGSDVKVTSGKRKKFKDGDPLRCVHCSYDYTNWDIMLAVAEGGKQGG